MQKVKVLGFGMLALFLSGCLVDMGRNRDVNPRRVYVNDAARNDSLSSGIVSEGVLFVLQPGKSYTLRMKTGATGDRLDFRERAGSGTFPVFRTIPGTAENGFLSFVVEPTKTTADFYYAFLTGPGGTRGTTPESMVQLIPAEVPPADSIKVRLLMVRQLTSPTLPGSMTESAKATYARTFHTELRSIYAAYGVTVDTSTVIVESGSAPLTVSFDAATFPIPGTRREQAVNIYLVDSISIEGSFGTILGFAPREAIDLATHPESRIVLNVRGGTASQLAVTAAHEMGHFFGLRHTSATLQDRGFDRDESNRDDGFTTPFCNVLEKSSSTTAPAQVITLKSPGGRAYCLRVAGASSTCSCPDVGNLMYPYSCNPSGQKALGADQRAFLRGNVRLYQ